ncbi:peptide chain release factor N(5)-glutamine methyltransferase [Marinigracilibium pacificum]|uniref:peptide chain release factor N(5)-glutamine methyltransferase n=1 Tax=Marinigracilibium pacificum TaxID=2729599 RepID=A0A848IY15_9BACT|nr:peptide chain release factor N(5)-glutamine methyltransferase [Marinigracilibium pacificum]NMM46869.1 peptide chain release factor N(5)-glutamine methyltransferase [Marinigracilibium pacificum]
MAETSSKKLYEEINSTLIEYIEIQEAGSYAFFILEYLFGLERIDIMMDKKIEVSTHKKSELSAIYTRVKAHEPIQYIFERAWFYGRTFKVDKRVLIPRGETEELVDLIIKEHGNTPNLKIADFGTGSGCIPITLALELYKPEVYGIDYDQNIIQLALMNGMINKADVGFMVADILTDDIDLPQLDIIVSNPPYIRLSEKKEMKENVLDYEPEEALFVPDEDPLIFYEKIADHGLKLLKPEGWIYFEINEALGAEVESMLFNKGYNLTKIIPDIHGKDRIVSARKS